MKHLLPFLILSIPIVIVSWKPLQNIKSHGFYRFFAWEGILWLFVNNYKFWFTDPFSIPQIIAWISLLYASYIVIAGLICMKKHGKAGQKQREDNALYGFERTSELVDKGIFAYIRHPLYGSLIFLTWAIFLKHITMHLLFVTIFSTVFMVITALIDEKECTAYFGDVYKDYMKRTKRFVPFLV